MSTKFKVDISGAEVTINDKVIDISGKEGKQSLPLEYPFISIKKTGDLLLVEAAKDVHYQKAIAGTIAANIRNMVKGVKEKYTAELELVYQHFPASMKLVGDKVVIENFVGERKPREIRMPKDVKVSINGTKIEIVGINKYVVGQAAAKIETKIQVKHKDRRVFKDGVYITKKP